MPLYSTAGFDRLEMPILGIRTVAYVAGVGPDVVYLHGGGTFHGFDFAREWLSRFRVYLPYHPGYGQSADAPSMRTARDYVRHYAALFAALELGRIHLVGASLGGRLAASIAIAEPNRVRSLTLVAPAGLTLPEFPQPDFSSISYSDWPAYFAHDPRVVRPFWPDSPDAAFLAARAREANATGPVLADCAATVADFTGQLGRVRAPTLLIWGREDRMMPAGNARAWHARMARSRVELVERAGHLLLDESAAARTAVADFMMQSESESQ